MFKEKTQADSEETKKRAYEVPSDKVELRSLKKTLRKKGMITNMAIQQYLLQHHGSTDDYKYKQYKQDSKKIDNDTFSSFVSSNEFQPRNLIQKQENGYKWNYPFEAASSSFENLRVAFDSNFE